MRTVEPGIASVVKMAPNVLNFEPQPDSYSFIVNGTSWLDTVGMRAPSSMRSDTPVRSKGRTQGGLRCDYEYDQPGARFHPT